MGYDLRKYPHIQLFFILLTMEKFVPHDTKAGFAIEPVIDPESCKMKLYTFDVQSI